MSRLNMVIADSDIAYVERLSAWFVNSYPNKLNLEIYTQKELILEYLADTEIKSDILLISPGLIPADKSSLGSRVVIIMSDSNTSRESDHYHCINKYQPADKLFNQIIEYYYEMQEDAAPILQGSSKTKVINIFSPQGNSGKTTISAILARGLARLGFKTLYISFRSINHLSLLPLTEIAQNNFSKLIYYIKQKSGSLAVKINTLTSLDQETSLEYLLTPDSSLELDELCPQDISKLFSEITSSGIYDYIVTVSDTSLSLKNLSLMECSDTVLIPITESRDLLHKINFLDKEIRKFSSIYKPGVSSKFLILLNKSYGELQDTTYPYPILASLPDIEKSEKEKYIIIKQLESYMKPVITKLINLMNSGVQ